MNRHKGTSIYHDGELHRARWIVANLDTGITIGIGSEVYTYRAALDTRLDLAHPPYAEGMYGRYAVTDLRFAPSTSVNTREFTVELPKDAFRVTQVAR